MAQRSSRPGRQRDYVRHEPRAMERLLARREREQLSYRELSESSGIPLSTLQWWQRRLRRKKRQARPERAHGPRVRFVELAARGPGEDASFELTLGNGRWLRVLRGFDVQEVRTLLAVLGEPC